VRDFLALAYTADMICEGGKPKHLSKTVDILRRLQDTSDTQMVIAGVMALDEIRDVSPLEFGLRMGEVHRKINETLRGDEDRKLPHVKDIK
jgi:hypothetical protein